MKKVINSVLVLIIIGVFVTIFISQPVSAMTGSGTVGDPYMIYDVGDLQDMDLDLDAYYELANDIDASATATWNWDGSKYLGFAPVGYDGSHTFQGAFDGNGYTISGLYINRPSTGFVGLFGYIYAYLGDRTIQNVNFADSSVTGNIYTGTLVGMASGKDVISPSTIYILTISNVVSWNGQVTGTNMEIGGLIGRLDTRCAMSYCSYGGYVTGTGSSYMVGGLIGYMSKINSVFRCSAYVVVSSPGTNTAGLIGKANRDSTVSECLSVGSVTSSSTQYGGIGGLIGRGDGKVYNSYSRCSVTGGSPGAYGEYVGGLTGSMLEATAITDNSYSTGYVIGGKYRGGLLAHNSGACTDSFWDTQTSGQVTSAGGTGKTTVEMKTESTFTDAGWDFDTIWAIGGAVNDGYPYLLWWYNPPEIIADIYQVVWFQPNYIIQGTELPNRTGNEDGEIHWGANPAGITISYSELVPEEEYYFEPDFTPLAPGDQDIIKPEPAEITTDVDLDKLEDNPLNPLAQMIADASNGQLTLRLVWLGMAWFILIAAMFFVHLGPDTHKDSEKPQHFILTSLTGLGLSSLFYVMGIFALWVPIMLFVGLIASIVYERMPVL